MVISWSKAVSMVWIRTSSGVKVTVALGWFVLPFGRPGRRLAPSAFDFLAAALALLAAFSASLRTTLLDAQWKGVPCLDTDERQGEKCQPWHRLPVQTGKEPIQAMGVLAGFGDDDFIACDQVDLIRGVHMVTEKYPKQYPPGDDRGEKTLDGAIAATFACPACEP